MGVKSILHSFNIALGLQHLEVFDENGVSFSYEHQPEGAMEMRSEHGMAPIAAANIEITKLTQILGGWFLVSVRPLKQDGELFGSLAVGS